MNSESNRNNNESKKTTLLYNTQWIFIFSKLLAPEIIDDRNLETEKMHTKKETLSTLTNKIIKPRLSGDLEQYTMWMCVVYISEVSLCANFPVPTKYPFRKIKSKVISLWGFGFSDVKNIIHSRGSNFFVFFFEPRFFVQICFFLWCRGEKRSSVSKNQRSWQRKSTCGAHAYVIT